MILVRLWPEAPRLPCVMFEWVFTVLVLLIGALGAFFWWRIAAKAAPYRDEVAKQERKRRERDQHQPTVVRGFDNTKRDSSQ